MYKSSAPGPGPEAQGGTGDSQDGAGGGAKPKENVVDAEFVDVDDQKK
jgi:hypothetical protein